MDNTIDFLCSGEEPEIFGPTKFTSTEFTPSGTPIVRIIQLSHNHNITFTYCDQLPYMAFGPQWRFACYNKP